MDTIMQVVNSVAFPIAVCCICFWYIAKLNDNHKAEIDKLSEALQNNTIVMQQLVDKLSGI